MGNANDNIVIRNEDGTVFDKEKMRVFCENIVRKYGWHACVFVCPYTSECAEYKKQSGDVPPCGAIIIN